MNLALCNKQKMSASLARKADLINNHIGHELHSSLSGRLHAIEIDGTSLTRSSLLFQLVLDNVLTQQAICQQFNYAKWKQK